MQQSRTHHRVFLAIGILVFVTTLMGLFLMSPPRSLAENSTAVAGDTNEMSLPDTVSLQATADPHAESDLACILCHSDTEEELEFPSGETLSVQVNPGVITDSAHGVQAANPLNCTDCHRPINDYQFPHEPVEVTDLRAYELERSETCESCHQQPHLTSHPGKEAALPVTCTDCHGSHEVETVDALRDGAGTDRCVNCHLEAGVDLADPDRLTPLIRNGLFADKVDNDYCLSCHSQDYFTMTFENGDTISLAVSEDDFHASVHGLENSWSSPLECTDCHTDYIYPHEPVTAPSARAYSFIKNETCAQCHEQKATDARDDVHGDALMEGNLDAAFCTDCHGAHDTPDPDVPRARISRTCAQCHSTIFDVYAESVHGEALLDESNPDVPTCVECHGVHNIADPTTNLFRIRSPELCAECHADEEMMERYDISTEVFETYVADFHGTTVMLFDPEDPNAEVNKAVCYDCHGVHDIKAPDDPEAGIKANLLETCQKCHPDATTNFADSWTSHYQPSLEHNPLVYLVDLFYDIVIPATVGFFGFMVFTDIFRRVRMRFSKGDNKH